MLQAINFFYNAALKPKNLPKTKRCLSKEIYHQTLFDTDDGQIHTRLRPPQTIRHIIVTYSSIHSHTIVLLPLHTTQITCIEGGHWVPEYVPHVAQRVASLLSVYDWPRCCLSCTVFLSFPKPHIQEGTSTRWCSCRWVLYSFMILLFACLYLLLAGRVPISRSAPQIAERNLTIVGSLICFGWKHGNCLSVNISIMPLYMLNPCGFVCPWLGHWRQKLFYCGYLRATNGTLWEKKKWTGIWGNLKFKLLEASQIVTFLNYNSVNDCYKIQFRVIFS